MMDRIKYMQAHDGIFIIRNALSTNKVLFLLRTAPCYSTNITQQYDEIMRQATKLIANVDFTIAAWKQASLPLRWGGLGIRSSAQLAPSAFIAFAAAAMNKIQAILPNDLSSQTLIYQETAINYWKNLQVDTATVEFDHTITRQRRWDDAICQNIYDSLLDQADTITERARLLAAKAPHTGDWLRALPITAIALKLSNEETRIAIGLRVGAVLTATHTCRCKSIVETNGHHGLSCRMGRERCNRHRSLNDVLMKAFNAADIPTTLEPHGLCPSDERRPDGITTIPWSQGKCLA